MCGAHISGRQPRKSGNVSQQNTFTGKLTLEMLRGVLEQAKSLAGI